MKHQVFKVKLIKPEDMTPSMRKRVVGTRGWRLHCHGAKTLNSAPGISNADVRKDFSTFQFEGELTRIEHEGPHAWLKSTVVSSDNGLVVRSRTVEIHTSEFKKVPRRTRIPGPPRTHCPIRLKVGGKSVACTRRLHHEGDCRPRKAPTPRFYSR